MICRMNKRQREALVALIEAIANERFYPSLENSHQRSQVEKDFHSCFENESSEDNYNHAEGT